MKTNVPSRSVAALAVVTVLAFTNAGQIRAGTLTAVAETFAAPPDTASRARLPPQWRSESAATNWSLLGTALPVLAGITSAASTTDEHKTPASILLASGFLIGPSLGYFYGDRSDRAWTGILIRLGISGLTAVVANRVSQSDGPSTGPGDMGSLDESIAVVGVGFTLVVIDDIVDIALVRGAVHQRNLARSRETISLAPIVCPDGRSVRCAVKVSLP